MVDYLLEFFLNLMVPSYLSDTLDGERQYPMKGVKVSEYFSGSSLGNSSAFNLLPRFAYINWRQTKYSLKISCLLLFGKVVTHSGKARQKGLSFVGVLLVMSDLANFHEICTAATYSGSLFIILPLNICITIIFITILSSPLTHNLYSELMTPTSHYAYPPTSYLPYHMPVLYYYLPIYHHLVSYHPKILYFLWKCGWIVNISMCYK